MNLLEANIVAGENLQSAEVLFPENNPVKFVDIAVTEISERVPYDEDDEPYLWGSSDPVMASVDKKGSLSSIEIQAFPSGPCDMDLDAYLREKNPETAELVLSDKNESPESYEFKGDKEWMCLRFANFDQDTTLYRIRKNVFLGFDKNGTLSEFICVCVGNE